MNEADFGGPVRGYVRDREIGLLPWLLLAAILLTLIDMLIALWLRGLMPALTRNPAAATSVAILLVSAMSWPVGEPAAQTRSDEAVISAANETHLAYVVTGLNAVDETSKAGLDGLSLVLNRRTAVEAGDPLPVNLGMDDLNLFPLLYWPIPPEHPDISREVRDRVDEYLRQGGHDPFRYRRCRHDDPGTGPGRGGASGACASCSRASTCRRSSPFPRTIR